MSARPSRRPVPDPGARPLALVAGLPPSTSQTVAAAVRSRFRGWAVMTAPFGVDDDHAYLPDRAVTALMRLACGLVASDLPREAAVPAPSRIVLCYVALPHASRLLDAFGWSVLPMRLGRVGQRRGWRSDAEVATREVVGALDATAAGPWAELQLQLLARGADEVLRLPGRNFELHGGGRLAERFSAAMRGDLAFADVGDGVPTRRFVREALPAYYARVGGDKKTFCIDGKERVFCFSNRGMHGPVRTPSHPERFSKEEARLFLEGLYRFGTPLPAGFQHDVQREGRLLRGEPFDCSRRGRIAVSGSHANVYANDVVRDP